MEQVKVMKSVYQDFMVLWDLPWLTPDLGVSVGRLPPPTPLNLANSLPIPKELILYQFHHNL